MYIRKKEAKSKENAIRSWFQRFKSVQIFFKGLVRTLSHISTLNIHVSNRNKIAGKDSAISGK